MLFRVDGRLFRVKGFCLRVDGRLIRVKGYGRYAVSKISGFVWTGPYRLSLYETKVQATLNNQTCVKGYAVSRGRKADPCKRVCDFVWTEG